MKKAIVLLVGLTIWFLAGKPIVWSDPQIPPLIPVTLAVGESFTTGGDWVVPAGVTSIIVEAWGGGGAGGGGGGNVNLKSGGGGAGGQYANITISVSVGDTYSVTIGAGGISPGNTSNGNPGDDTIFGSNLVVAKGGAGGIVGTSTATGGIGTTASGIGDTVYRGGNGGIGSTSSYASGGGGGGTGSTGAGGDASGTTAGIGTSEYGGDGGAGVTTTNTAGNPGNQYSGGGSGGARNGLGGAGYQGYLIVSYNSPPVFSVGTSDAPDPVNIGSTVTFTATATDADSDNWYLAVCKTNLINAGSPPTCDTSQTFCVSSSAVASASENSCDWGSDTIGALNWYAFACDDAASNPACSAVDTTNSPLTVNGLVSITITTDGTISFGYLDLGTSQTTGPSGIGDTQIVSVDSGPADLDIRSTNFIEAGNTWFLGTGIGATQVQWEFSKDDSVWTTFAVADNLYPLDTNVAQGQTRSIYLRLTMPTSTDSLNQYSSTVTVVASSP